MNNYVVIDTFGPPEQVKIVTDEEGNNIIFTSRKKAREFIKQELQCGVLALIQSPFNFDFNFTCHEEKTH